MIFLNLSPVGLSLLLLAAHFYRAQMLALSVLSVALLALLSWRRGWAARVLQAALVLAALEWLRTGVLLVQERAALGQPVARLALILGAVATLTALSALLLRRPRVRAYFNPKGIVPTAAG